MKPTPIVLLLLLWLHSHAQADHTFIHPGARYGKFELDFVKAQIATGSEPWTSLLEQAQNASSDAQALGLALNWYYRGDTTSANSAIAILNQWNNHSAYTPAPVNGGNQSSLEAAWAASVLAPAAELLSLYPQWSQTDREATRQMFRTVFLPALMQMSYWNGNVDLTQIDALLSVAVFLEDQTAWAEGIRRLQLRLPAYFYLASDPKSARTYANGTYNWSAANGCAPLQWIDGIMQESCRDNGHHGQFAIAAALEALETAYLQGVDLYTPHQERMVDAMELLARQLQSNDMQGACAGDVTADRYNTLEVGYNHYHNRKGIELPYTRAEILAELRDGSQQFNMFYETLTNGDIDYSGTAIRRHTPLRLGSPKASLRITRQGEIGITHPTGDGSLKVYGVGGTLIGK